MILLDTCALLWWTLQPSRLSEPARTACGTIGDTGAVISSISMWEIGIKMKKGTLSLPLSLNEYVKRVKKVENVEIVPVDETIWIKNIEFDWSHRDPADRTIVATAMLRDIPIVTKDTIISSFYQNIIW